VKGIRILGIETLHKRDQTNKNKNEIKHTKTRLATVFLGGLRRKEKDLDEATKAALAFEDEGLEVLLVDELEAVEDVEGSTDPPAVAGVWVLVDPSLESCYLSLRLLSQITKAHHKHKSEFEA
jgi:hypothetical protein